MKTPSRSFILFFIAISLIFSMHTFSLRAAEYEISGSEGIEIQGSSIRGKITANTQAKEFWLLLRYPERKQFQDLIFEQSENAPLIKKIRLSAGEGIAKEVELEAKNKKQKVDLTWLPASSWIKLEIVDFYESSMTPSSTQGGFFSIKNLKLELDKSSLYEPTCIKCREK